MVKIMLKKLWNNDGWIIDKQTRKQPWDNIRLLQVGVDRGNNGETSGGGS